MRLRGNQRRSRTGLCVPGVDLKLGTIAIAHHPGQVKETGEADDGCSIPDVTDAVRRTRCVVRHGGQHGAGKPKRTAVGRPGVGGTVDWGGGRYSIYGEVQETSSLSHFRDSYSLNGTLGFRMRW